MPYPLIALLETAGVGLLALAGILLGWWLSKKHGALWGLGFGIPFLLLVLVAIPRWVPKLESVAPFQWIHAGRTEFALMAVISTLLLTTPLARLRPLQRRYVGGFMVFFTIYCSILPFVSPAFTYKRLSALETNVDPMGVCLQSTRYNCGPAAAVTTLRKLGYPAEESTLALAAKTNPFIGTPTDSLAQAIGEITGAPVRIQFLEEIDELLPVVPCVAVVKFSFMIDHYVSILSITDDAVIVGDPLTGICHIPRDAFSKQWRGYAVVVDPAPTQQSHHASIEPR